jgi:hypothetical protein
VRPNSHAVAIPAVEVLCHEWAHALAWNFTKDSPVNGTSAPVFRLMSDS